MSLCYLLIQDTAVSFVDLFPEWKGVFVPHPDTPPLAWKRDAVINTADAADSRNLDKQEEEAVNQSEDADLPIALGEGDAEAFGDSANHVVCS